MSAKFSVLGLGYARYGAPEPFGLSEPDRLMHLYIIGQTGTGKSTLIENLAIQDARQGTGFCLLDPHGDLARKLADVLGSSCLYWDVADPACRYGYNPLTPVSASLRPLVASGVIETLKKQWSDAWGARMEHILRFCLLALLEQPQADLRDVVRLLVFKGFRRQVTDRLSDPQVQFFWRHEFPALNHQTSGDGIVPIANKIGAFLAHPEVRRALCEPGEALRLRSLMDTGQAVIVNLGKGRLGSDVSNVVGGLIASSVMHAAFTRQGLPELARPPFHLYADEFQNFTTKTFASSLGEARKYGLALTLAHQHVGQAKAEVSGAILGNVGSIVAFRVGPADAPLMARYLEPFTVHDLMSQTNHRATVRLMRQGTPTRAFSASMFPSYQAH